MRGNRTVQTHLANQWTPEGFGEMVDHNERKEIRVAAAYEGRIDRALIRDQVMNAILSYVMPAGNA